MKLDLSRYDHSVSEYEQMIDEWVVGRNAKRNREILKRSLIEGDTYERIAAEFDLTPRHIKRIVYKSQEQLFRHL